MDLILLWTCNTIICSDSLLRTDYWSWQQNRIYKNLILSLAVERRVCWPLGWGRGLKWDSLKREKDFPLSWCIDRILTIISHRGDTLVANLRPADWYFHSKKLLEFFCRYLNILRLDVYLTLVWLHVTTIFILEPKVLSCPIIVSVLFQHNKSALVLHLRDVKVSLGALLHYSVFKVLWSQIEYNV